MWHFNFSYLLKNKEGFLLLEVAIALTILGTALGLGLPTILSYLTWQKRQTTKEKQERIIYSMAAYAVQNGHTPLPADPYATGETFGRARTEARKDSDRIGLVPFKTLGLSPEDGKDGFNRYFTYVGGKGKSDTDLTPITIKDDKGNTLLEGHDIALLLISHGEKGHGAYMGTMGHMHQYQSPLMGKDEKQNSDQSLSFVKRPFSKNDKDFFDHQLYWITNTNFIAIYVRPTSSFIRQSPQEHEYKDLPPPKDDAKDKLMPKTQEKGFV